MICASFLFKGLDFKSVFTSVEGVSLCYCSKYSNVELHHLQLIDTGGPDYSWRVKKADKSGYERMISFAYSARVSSTRISLLVYICHFSVQLFVINSL